MRSAACLWRLSVAVGALAVLATAFGAFAAVRAVEFDASIGAFMDLCLRYVTPDPGAGPFAVTALGSLSVTVAVLAVRAMVREWRALRRFQRTECPQGTVMVAGRRVLVVEDDTPRAYCAGWWRPAIYVSTGTLGHLDRGELEAVVAHEAHHADRRDPLRLLVVKVLGEAMFFVPVLRHLRKRYAAFAEIAADEAAVAASGGPQPLASALLRFGQTPIPGVVAGIAPERVDHLLGERPSWELPVSLLARGLVTVTGLALLAAGTASAIPPGAVSASTLAAQACMVAMTVISVVAGAFLLLVATRRLHRSR